jgi:formate C-acetyltransferase
MNDRIAKLRELSLNARPIVSAERGLLITEFFDSARIHGCSLPVQRALAFHHILANKAVYIGEGELIVGERGPAPKATPTYPEVCCHSLQDLDILDTRPLTSFGVDAETKKAFEDTIIPFWSGRSQRDRIMSEMSDEWRDCYAAGIFTEFMEQRAPGHTALDDKIYSKGMVDFQEDIRSSIDSIDLLNDPEAYDKKEQLTAMAITADAIMLYADRHAAAAAELASKETDPTRKRELERIAEVCSYVPAHAPRDFWEALQTYWFVHLGVIIEYNTWDAFNPGRLDQHLYPFYKKGLEDGSLTEESARELLQAFWVKFNNQPAPPKVGVTAQESGTYTDFALINVGGVKPDGSDGVNDLSFLILDVVEEMRILQPSSMVQISKKGPDRFIDRALKIIRTGFGQPSMFNTDAIVQELLRQGKSIEDARCGGASGCVEAGAFGKENYCLTGYFNLPKVLEIALNDGVDPRTDKRLGISTGDARKFTSFDEVVDAFKRQLHHFVEIKIRGNNTIERLYAEFMPAPFLSLLISDCIAKGKDYHAGGARYNTNYIQGVGLGTITDCLSAVKFHVFELKSCSMAELLEALAADFKGKDVLRARLLERTPKYGNDDDRADDLMRLVFEAYFAEIDGRPTVRGGRYRINLLPTTAHVYFGSVLGASADGRHAGEPVSEGVSPVQGADRQGPTAVMKSLAKIDHVRTGGTLLNQKFTPQFLADDDGIKQVRQLVRTYFKLDGHHVQFNVVSVETLRDAQKHPEKHKDLIVRVAGYSDYFADLSVALQDEIIRRTEHAGVG